MKSIALVSYVLFFATSCVFAQKSTYGKISYEKAVNLSGKQRMLSQKIAKVVLLKIAGAETPALKAELLSSKTIFERNLKILEANSKDQSSKTKALIRNEFQEWSKFKGIISKPAVDINVLLSMSEALLTKCNNLVVSIEEESKFSNELNYSSPLDQLKVKTVNLSGKQRMLSQRLCLYYTACKIFRKGKKADVACLRYQNIFTEINDSLNNLLVNELNNAQIDVVLSDILNIINFLEANKKDFRDNSIPLGEIITTTNNMLDLFNKATSLYSI